MSGERKKVGSVSGEFPDSGGRVVLRRVDPEAMFLRQSIADGDIGGRDFAVTLTTGGALLVEFKDPRSVYAVTVSDLVETALIAESSR